MRKLSQREVTLQCKRQESSFSLGYTGQTGMPRAARHCPSRPASSLGTQGTKGVAVSVAAPSGNPQALPLPLTSQPPG